MADLGNLFDVDNDDDGDDGRRRSDDYDERYGDGDADAKSSGPAEIPAVLAAAAAERRRRLDEGAGREEEDYRASSAAGDEGDEDDDGDGRNYDPEYEQLKALWTSEIACPELLPHDAETVAHVAEVLEKQEDVVEELLRRSRQQRQSREPTGELASLVAQITKMDLDRTRFMLVDMARTRMAKIENHALHNRTMLDRMTEEEKSYLRQYGELLEKHLRRTVLNQLPKEAWKKLDEPEMIDSPDLEQFVFCRVLETVNIDVTSEPNVLNDDQGDDENEDDFGDNLQEHQVGSCLVVMYKKIMDLVLEGKVELLM
ncbi:hypothetical protein ACHAWF_010104 [Thalassiosira exigua]